MSSALQFGIRRAAKSALIGPSTTRLGVINPTKSTLGLFNDNLKRWKSTDAGDVIGIDLGTTNSCVATMVSLVLT